MFNWLNAEIITQGGSVTVALFAIGMMFYVVKKFTTILANHLHDQHEDNLTRSKNDKLLANAIGKMSEKINNLK